MVSMNLAGKTAIVTGSSRGIGKAIAVELAKEGADIVVVGRTEAPGGRFPGSIHETAAEIAALGRRSLAIRADLTKDADIESMANRALDELGRIDVLVNNAGVSLSAPFMKTTAKRWDLIMNVDLRGVFLCCRAVLPGMIERKGGTIINVTSAAGLAMDPAYYSAQRETSVAYATAKCGANMLTVALAREMARHNVAINALLPDWTATETVLAMARPERLPAAMQSPRMWGRYAALLCSSDARSITGRLFTREELEREFGKVP